MTINEKIYATWGLGFFIIAIYGFLEIESLSTNIRWLLLFLWITLGAIVGTIRLWKTK